jgi:hypothetical protein
MHCLLNLDSSLYSPDRWIDPPKAAHGIPGVWGNQLSFIGGPKSCIGYRFAIVELVPSIHSFCWFLLTSCARMKALLFALIRSFEFELAVPPDQIIQKSR